jgi:hypothetical protein
MGPVTRYLSKTSRILPLWNWQYIPERDQLMTNLPLHVRYHMSYTNRRGSCRRLNPSIELGLINMSSEHPRALKRPWRLMLKRGTQCGWMQSNLRCRIFKLHLRSLTEMLLCWLDIPKSQDSMCLMLD